MAREAGGQPACAISPPEPGLTPRQLIARAVSLRPMLRAQQAACEAAGRILPETHRAFVEGGFYRTLQPRRFGGYEFALPVFAETMIEITRGCPSSGWVLAFTAGHPHVLAKFPEQAQIEAYGDDGDFRAPFVGSPGSAEPAEGGLRINGAWDYATGCDVATHFMATVARRGADAAAPPETLSALIDREDFTIVENWEMLGMRGTGSHRVVVTDRVIPLYRTARSERALPTAEAPRSAVRIHDNPLYASPSGNVLMAEIAAVAIGTGLCALDSYEWLLRERTTRGPSPVRRAESAEFQRHFGQAQALLNTARAALLGCTQEYMAFCRQAVEEEAPFSLERSQGIVLVEQQCTRLAGEAVDLLLHTAGSSAARPGTVLERCFRDMATLRTHISLQFDTLFEAFARTHLGIGSR
ncbi:MAG TPA: oxidoreductase [Dehalococcoidia bacterium]|nr:oxidoreductase [Dehalococcoidia bacterium]